jgi:hypothetical protein
MSLLQVYWIVPLGMIALFYYGRFHFNTPDYALELDVQDGEQVEQSGRLISLAPPIFTTSRSRFNRYSLRYILILEILFLIMIFLPSVIADTADILKLKLPISQSSDSIQHSALFALFALTGLLSSFPILKELDAWILRRLHEAAFIPEEAKRLAEQLYAASFSPDTLTKTAVLRTLNKRDTVRVAKGRSVGSLETMVLQLLWLRTKLSKITATDAKYIKFKVKLIRDLNDVASASNALKAELIGYFKDQEELVPVTTNIDNYINENTRRVRIKELGQRRERLLKTTSALFRRLCLMTALMVYATEFTPADVGQQLDKVGFKLDVTATPAWDWQTVFNVTAIVFIASLVFNIVFTGILPLFGLENSWTQSLTRSRIFSFSLMGTIVYLFVVLIAIQFKRRCWLGDAERKKFPENILIATSAYVVVVVCYLIIQFALRGSVNSAPLFLSAADAAAAYFLSVYIDRSMLRQARSLMLACLQGGVQAILAFGGTFFSPAPPDSSLDLMRSLDIAGFSALQSGITGFVIGLVFQYYYQRTEFSAKTTTGVVVLGDMAVRRAAVEP